MVAYGYIIASIAAGLTNADSGRAQYQSGETQFCQVLHECMLVRGCVDCGPLLLRLQHFIMYHNYSWKFWQVIYLVNEPFEPIWHFLRLVRHGYTTVMTFCPQENLIWRF